MTTPYDRPYVPHAPGMHDALSIQHERSASGHSDMADATVSAVAATRVPPERKPPSKLHYIAPGHAWIEDAEEKPFNWPHLVRPGDPEF